MLSFSGDVHAGKLIETGSIVYCLVIMMMMMIMILVTMMISDGDLDGYRGGDDSDGGGHY